MFNLVFHRGHVYALREIIMETSTKFWQKWLLFLLICLAYGPANALAADGDRQIDSAAKYVWSENAGWFNFKPTGGEVIVHSNYLSGYAWAANVGWIKLGLDTADKPYSNTDDTDWGVNFNADTGALSGNAWGENVGWISFFNNGIHQVTIDPDTCDFSGYAWNANIGFIHFANDESPVYKVKAVSQIKPNAPTNVTATAGDATATVSFTASAANCGPAITGYTVIPSASGVDSNAGSTATSHTITGLSNDTAYTFTVKATNMIGDSDPSSPSSPAVTPKAVVIVPTITVPSPPGGVTAKAGIGLALVSFSVPNDGGSAITGYTVTSNPGGKTVTGTTSPINVTGLTNGTAYTFTVKATNTKGDSAASPPSSPVTPAAIAPGPPSSVTAKAGNTQAIVSFSPPTNDGGSTITKYTVTSTPGNKTTTGSSSPITVTGLTNGTEYTFSVVASNTAGPGPSASIKVTPCTLPAAPTNVTASAGIAQATVTFTAPASNGGSAITGYTITSTPGGKTAELKSPLASPLTSTVTGLTNGTAYTFTVKALNAVGAGVASAASNSVTTATVPGKPNIGTATRKDSKIEVAFTAPASNGGSTITGYTVTSAPEGKTVTGTASPLTVLDLTNGKAYTFKVKATNEVGTGVDSVASNSVTPSTAPATAPGQANTGTASRGNASAIIAFAELTADGGSAISKYMATSTPDGKTAEVKPPWPSPLVITVPGLTNGKAYTFTLKALNEIGPGIASKPSNSVTPATVPGKPTIGSATAGNASAIVAFTPTLPTANGGSAITKYTVTSSPGGKMATGLKSPIPVPGLTNGTAYTFTVTATNAAGDGLPSLPSKSVIPATVPGKPSGVSATKANASAIVAFTPPTETGGSVIKNYTVTPAPGAKPITGTTSPITVPGLTNGTAYTFTVKAINAVGPGIASLPSTSVTPAPAPTAPKPPTIGKVSLVNSSALVAFTLPTSNGGSPITGYTVTVTELGGKTTFGTKSPIPVTGLPNGTYTFTVTAANVIGSSLPSKPSAKVVINSSGDPASIVVQTSAPEGKYPVCWTASPVSGVTYVVEESTFYSFSKVKPVTAPQFSSGIYQCVNINNPTTTNTYYYRVKSQKAKFTDSNWLAAANGCAVPGSSAVLPPTALSFSATIAKGYTVSWDDSTNIGATYFLEEATNSSFTSDLRTAYTGTAKTTKITSRTTGITYYYRIRAIKAGAKDSAWKVGGSQTAT